MKRYLFNSALVHFGLLTLFFLLSYLSPEPKIIWLDAGGFDFAGGGGGKGGEGGQKGEKAGEQLKLEKRGEDVPNPVQAPVPNKPAPVQNETRGEEAWIIKNEKKIVPSKTKPDNNDLIPRGTETQNTQSNVVRRGVKKGSVEGQGDFNYGEGTGEGTGLPVGVGFGPGGSGGFGFGSYLGILRKRIWAEWDQYKTIGSDKSCVVALTVSKVGQVSDIDLEESSGDAFFDNVAKRAVRNSSPLPPLPPSFPKDNQRFRIKFKLID